MAGVIVDNHGNEIASIHGIENGQPYEILSIHTKADGEIWSAVTPVPPIFTAGHVAGQTNMTLAVVVTQGVPPCIIEWGDGIFNDNVQLNTTTFHTYAAGTTQANIVVTDATTGSDTRSLSLPVTVPPAMISTDWRAEDAATPDGKGVLVYCDAFPPTLNPDYPVTRIEARISSAGGTGFGSWIQSDANPQPGGPPIALTAEIASVVQTVGIRLRNTQGTGPANTKTVTTTVGP
jgi:hypothetical protein